MSPTPFHPGGGPRLRTGFSLVEIMVAMGVFAILATVVVSAVLQGRKLAEDRMFESTVYTVLQGYMEQMRGVPLNELENPTLLTRDQAGAADTLVMGLVPSGTQMASWTQINRRADNAGADQIWGSVRTQYPEKYPNPPVNAAQKWQGNIRLVDVKNTPDNLADDLLLEIKPLVRRLSPSDPYYVVQLHYRYLPPSKRGFNRRIEGVLQSIVSQVPIY